jgi:tryprostatin B 6-hydroxylase
LRDFSNVCADLKFAGQPIDMSKWFNYWSFDVMGDLAFGRSFNMMESAGEHWAIKLLNTSQDDLGLALPPWISRLCWHIAPLRAVYDRFHKFCASEMEERIRLQGKQPNPDITHYLIEDLNAKDAEGQKTALPLLHLDSKLIIVAGSDTTAATLTFLFYHLAIEPGLISRLREEVETLVGDANSKIEHQHLQSASLLNACINETLRLHPPVPSGLYRKTPPEGVYIGDEWIPGNTTIQIHLYSMARGKSSIIPLFCVIIRYYHRINVERLADDFVCSPDESNFVMAEQFIPERFSSQPDLVKNKDAFAPFSIGPYGCIGKNLAYMEIRLLTAQLITRFDVSLAPGEDGTDLLNSVDHFTIGLKPINMIFTRRTSGTR